MLGKLRTAASTMGAFAACLYAADRALTRLTKGKSRVYFYRLEVQPVPAKPLLPAHRGRQFEIRELPLGDAAHAMGPRPPEAIALRYAQGSKCFGAFLGERLVGQIWLQLTAYQEDEVRCRFALQPPDKVAWDYDVYIEPEFRTGFLFARLWDAAFSYLRGAGIEWTASRISAFNVGSMTAHRRLGAQPAGRAIFLKLGGVQLMCADTAPYFHATLTSASRATLIIAAPAAIA